MLMSRITRGASNLGKIAKDYGMMVSTLMDLIKPYPELMTEIDKHISDRYQKAQKTLPPVVVDLIYSTLGEP
jgi:hypothetical protein